MISLSAATRIRRAWESGLVWRFGWHRVVATRFECVEAVGPFEEPS
jgi:hypothetical protein